MSSAPPRITELIETFDRNIETYHSPQYNETQLRREFIDPFFEELGWDVSNKRGYAQAYKEVIHEDTIKVGTATKAPDYSFRIGGVRKFFLEAKKPSINIGGDPHPAYQLRRYAWSARLPLSILTDFEEFAVYDCQMRPKQTDGSSTARIMFLTYKDYIDKWNEISDIFSREAVLKGSFDKFAVSAKAKRGTTTVDKEFLAELEKWRADLARIIALRNTTLPAHEINFAVQRTIDRIIFLRMCEDRGIEQYGQLQIISNGGRTYPRLCEVFERADEKYNSGLFHFRQEKGRAEPPDELTLNLTIDDAPLSYILHSLYYPQCPYVFSYLPPEILGNVYEQFLGSVIYVSRGRRIKVEPKPEVKKAGGIYYTPDYIVDYIVKNTVGRLLNDPAVCHCEERSDEAISISPRHCEPVGRGNPKPLTPKQIENIKILDPACGSGSFLLGAYTYLLNYIRDWYVENDPKKYTKQIYQGRGGLWFLTIAEKKKILLNSIFGVDIDSQAVEVTKLSLLLKVLEGESQESLLQFHERALPDLGNNIKCGNSLIGPDFFDNPDIDSSDDELRQKINAFDWHAEFPQVFKQGGFDAIIGNPPYIPIETMGAGEKEYYQTHHVELQRKYDSSVVFILAMLANLKASGYLGFISSVAWQTGENFSKLREHLFNKAGIVSLVNLPFDVFRNAYVDTGVYILSGMPCDSYGIYRFPKKEQIRNLSNIEYVNIPRDMVLAPDYKIVLEPKAHVMLSRFSGDVFSLLEGFTISTQGLAGNRFEQKDTQERKAWYPFFAKGQVHRYSLLTEKMAFVDMGKYPSLKRFYEAEPKVLVRRVISRQDRIMATYTNERMVFKKDINPFIITDAKWNPLFVLGVLNSKLISYLYVNISSIATKDDFRQTTLAELRRIPIRTIDFDNPDDKTKHDKIVKLVDRMLDLNKKLAAAKVPDEKIKLQRQISATDSQIDNLVYDLYNLTPEEIKIVEEQK